MSDADREKWDRRYREGAYAARAHPSAFLEECIPLLPPPGRALDLACGTGRNAHRLAELGFAVDAVDISPEALAIGRSRNPAAAVRWIELDLDSGFVPDSDYDVIVNIRFVNLPLLQSLLASLRPNGALLVEQHLVSDDLDVVGPSNPAYRARPGALAKLAAGLTVERLAEGTFEDPDGRRAALARLFARRPVRY